MGWEKRKHVMKLKGIKHVTELTNKRIEDLEGERSRVMNKLRKGNPKTSKDLYSIADELEKIELEGETLNKSLEYGEGKELETFKEFVMAIVNEWIKFHNNTGETDPFIYTDINGESLVFREASKYKAVYHSITKLHKRVGKSPNGRVLRSTVLGIQKHLIKSYELEGEEKDEDFNEGTE